MANSETDAPLRFVERWTLQLHLAAGQRGDHGLGRELAQLAARGRLFVGTAGRGRVFRVAQRALGGEDQLVFRALGRKQADLRHQRHRMMDKEIRIFPPGKFIGFGAGKYRRWVSPGSIFRTWLSAASNCSRSASGPPVRIPWGPCAPPAVCPGAGIAAAAGTHGARAHRAVRLTGRHRQGPRQRQGRAAGACGLRARHRGCGDHSRVPRGCAGIATASDAAGPASLSFDIDTDLVFNRRDSLPLHPNGMRFEAFDAGGAHTAVEGLLFGGRRIRRHG